MSNWEVARCMVASGVREDQEHLAELLADGWEPFAVVGNMSAGYVYHFRRRLEDGNPDSRCVRGEIGGEEWTPPKRRNDDCDAAEDVDPWVQDELDRMD